MSRPIETKKFPPQVLPSHRGALAGKRILRRRGGEDLVERLVDLFVALNDADVVAGLDERDALGKHFGIIHPDALGPALDPGSTGVVRGENVAPLLVLAE